MKNIKLKRYIKKAISWAGLFFFILAAIMLYVQLSKYPFSDIKKALLEIPTKNVVYACFASFLGYVALSSYDYLALKYIGRKLAAWKWILVGFIGFSISNNAGHAIVSGGAVRYRLYTRWRFKTNEIVKMVTFSGFTYLFACFALIVLGYFLTPSHALGAGSMSTFTTHLVTALSAIGLLGYFALTLCYKKLIRIKKLQFNMPSFKMALAQVVLGSADIVLAALVLYFVLIPFVQIPFDIFIGVFIIAQVLGVFSQVPGGLGVFEGLFMVILPGDNNAAHLFGALIAYRIIYYLLPLLISAVVLGIYENRLRYKRKVRKGLL
ncbi:MAG: UPF0104 family protein [Alphaproteobacteria bacterium]|nr:UPF0104 family protein [Alphaproteobacteria bacterium]